MPIRTGNIASGDDFFDREIELEDIWNYVEGNHIALNGPRRLGKSSILVRLAEQAAEKGMLAQRIDVSGVTDAAEFLAEFEAAFPDTWIKRQMEGLGSNLKDFANRFRKVDIKVPGIGGGVELDAIAQEHWKKNANKLQVRLIELPTLIMIDEFSVFLEKLINHDRDEAEQLLAWLRKWRQEQTGCRFIFSGSIGLNSLLERHHLTTQMNDCHDFKLGPFRKKAAVNMLKILADREKWQLETEIAEYLSHRVGWLSPFYLNLLLDETLKAARDRLLEFDQYHEQTQRVVLADDVDDAYERLLSTRSRFIHWYKRLQRDLSEPQLSVIFSILRYIARSEDGLTRRQLIARLASLEPDLHKRNEILTNCLAYLEENGYLSDAPKIQFLSFLLRDYWKNNYAH